MGLIALLFVVLIFLTAERTTTKPPVAGPLPNCATGNEATTGGRR